MQISDDVFEKVVTFHGHLCPGLATGIRAAELVLQEMRDRAVDEEMVAVVENDNCSVDAIQFITGCTFGKGNLIFQDYGKNVYRFYRRSDGKAIRISQKNNKTNQKNPEHQSLIDKKHFDTLTNEEQEKLAVYRQTRIENILKAELNDLFDLRVISDLIPEKARIYESLSCAGCDEMTMETRVRRINGEWYCLPCYFERERLI